MFRERVEIAILSLCFADLDFLAEVTQHLPDPGEHLNFIRYYGWYSNLPAPGLRQAGKTRGQRAQRRPAAAPAETGIPARSPTAREARKGWAAVSGCRPEAVGCSRGAASKSRGERLMLQNASSLQPDMIEKILRSRRRGTDCRKRPRLGPRR
jgi:hypothetical protein